MRLRRGLDLAPTRRTVRALFAAAAAAILLATASHLAREFGWRWNDSASLPRGLYRLRALRSPLKRGTFVLACPPLLAARLARERGYLPAGDCPGDVEPVGKWIVARAGEVVRVDADGVRINGRLLPHSRPLARDCQGRPLPDLRGRTFRLRAGEFWLFSPLHPRSFDSRVFGTVRREEVHGVLESWAIFERRGLVR